jgi:hypothetical protein
VPGDPLDLLRVLLLDLALLQLVVEHRARGEQALG